MTPEQILAEMNRQQLEKARQNQQPMGLMDRIGQGFSNMMNDPNTRDRLIIGLQGMATNPNQALVQMAQGNIQRRREMADLNKQTNKTIEFLRSRGVPEAELQALKDNPQMLMQYAQAVLKRQGEKPSAPKSYAPMVDPATGQVVLPTFDPTTGGASFSTIEGLSQLTPEQKAKLETEQAIYQQDLMRAKEAASQAMNQASSVESKIPLYEDAIEAVMRGADSGFIQKYLPAFNEATAALRSAANQLGITVINSATFGALSQTELDIAMSTEINMDLKGQDLIDHLKDKRLAQIKLANALRQKARDLSQSGVTYSDYIMSKTENDISTDFPEVIISEDDSDVVKIQ